MKISIKKTLPLYQAEAYLEMNINKLRPDIRDYLYRLNNQHESIDSNYKHQRIQAYLKQIGLLDEYGQELSGEGEQVLETGRHKHKEMGLYQLFWIASPLSNEREIVYFERIAPKPKPEGKEVTYSYQKENLCLQPKKAEATPFQVTKLHIHSLETTSQQNLDWSLLYDKEQETYIQRYNIKGLELEKKKLQLQGEQSLDEDRFWNYLNEHLIYWSDSQNCLLRKYEDIKHDAEAIDNLVLNATFQHNDHEIRVENTPIRPVRDFNDGRKWLLHYLSRKLAPDYIAQGVFEQYEREYRERLRLPDLSPLHAHAFLKEVQKAQLEAPDRPWANSEAYWHLAAKIDL